MLGLCDTIRNSYEWCTWTLKVEYFTPYRELFLHSKGCATVNTGKGKHGKSSGEKDCPCERAQKSITDFLTNPRELASFELDHLATSYKRLQLIVN